MIAQTSLMAHREAKKPHGDQRARVLGMLKRFKRGRTNSELAAALKMQPSTVAARINDLKKMGLVEAAEQRHCQITGYTAKVHQVVPQ